MSSTPTTPNRVAVLIRIYLVLKFAVNVSIHPVGQTRPAFRTVVHLPLELGVLLGLISDGRVGYVGPLCCNQLPHNILVLQAPQSKSSSNWVRSCPLSGISGVTFLSDTCTALCWGTIYLTGVANSESYTWNGGLGNP